MPVPRVAVCTIETMDLFEQLSKTGQVLHAAYSCDHPRPGARRPRHLRSVGGLKQFMTVPSFIFLLSFNHIHHFFGWFNLRLVVNL